MISRIKREVSHKIFWYQQKKSSKYSFIHINKCGGTSVEIALGLPKTHDTAFFRREKVGAEAWRRMFKFAIVRHPFSRMVSDYRFRVKTNQNRLEKDKISFDEWIHKAIVNRDHFYYDKPILFSSCWQWITDLDRRSVIVDEVVKLEEIDAHWDDLCGKIGCPNTVPLPHANKTEESRVEEAIKFMSEESRHAIRVHFREDFENLGYQN